MIEPDTASVHEIHLRVIGLDQLRDFNLLDSAVHRPFQSFGGVEFYPDFLDKAAVILHGIISNHAFVDGNKRTAYAVMSEMIEQNGCGLDTGNIDSIVEFLVEIAESQHTLAEVKVFIESILVRRTDS